MLNDLVYVLMVQNQQVKVFRRGHLILHQGWVDNPLFPALAVIVTWDFEHHKNDIVDEGPYRKADYLQDFIQSFEKPHNFVQTCDPILKSL